MCVQSKKCVEAKRRNYLSKVYFDVYVRIQAGGVGRVALREMILLQLGNRAWFNL